ncbi:MAG: hypothetical protein DHS20C03_19630 [Minwuia thermotolerans]|nr:MAG: hypothetical protein DHS20C03_19630 [Minwuia thermotolerans]
MPVANALSFPDCLPAGYDHLPSEPTFDPARHLALEHPTKRVSLADLGYAEAEIAACPSDLGITAPFRVLSDEGAACLLEVARQLAPFAISLERIERMVRGGTYRSRFLRDLCQSPEVNAFMSEVFGAPLLPHTIPHQLGHLNFNPTQVGRNVDKWHTDTLRIDYVMFVTDPRAVQGGEFQYFQGTKHEMKALAEAGQPIPPDRMVSPALPGPGYAVLQQGNMVVHRAKGLREAAERITMVNGYVPAEIGFPDFTRYDQLYLADPHHVVTEEYARHVSWMGREMLTHRIDNPAFTDDRLREAERFEQLAHLFAEAAGQIRNAGAAREEHFGDGE